MRPYDLNLAVHLALSPRHFTFLHTSIHFAAANPTHPLLALSNDSTHSLLRSIPHTRCAGVCKASGIHRLMLAVPHAWSRWQFTFSASSKLSFVFVHFVSLLQSLPKAQPQPNKQTSGLALIDLWQMLKIDQSDCQAHHRNSELRQSIDRFEMSHENATQASCVNSRMRLNDLNSNEVNLIT